MVCNRSSLPFRIPVSPEKSAHASVSWRLQTPAYMIALQSCSISFQKQKEVRSTEMCTLQYRTGVNCQSMDEAQGRKMQN